MRPLTSFLDVLVRASARAVVPLAAELDGVNLDTAAGRAVSARRRYAEAMARRDVLLRAGIAAREHWTSAQRLARARLERLERDPVLRHTAARWRAHLAAHPNLDAASRGFCLQQIARREPLDRQEADALRREADRCADHALGDELRAIANEIHPDALSDSPGTLPRRCDGGHAGAPRCAWSPPLQPRPRTG